MPTDLSRATSVGGWLEELPGDPGGAALHVDRGGRLETLSRAEVAARVAGVAVELRGDRRLVQVQGGNTLETVVAYLGAHAAGHPVLLTPPPGRAAEQIASTWRPDVVIDPRGRITGARTPARHDLHPDLALLTSTSGSTGSPRLVRLSWDNLRSNAAAIADYLGVRADDRAVTSLPLHYCYGLSVLHSHLLAGASVVLTDRSVADPGFWDLARDARVTTLAAVPHTVDLLDRVGLADLDLPHLRTLTQAGGRLDPSRVLELATLGRRRGWDLFVMYGQTEATARMTYLPPDLALTHPSCVGVPVAGSSIEIVDGEVVFEGPGVMLGYATEPGHLALGRTVERLHTGDLGRWNDGLLEITGRASRIAKVFGHRVDLDQVETSVRAAGHEVRCVAGEPGVVAFVAAVGEEPGTRPPDAGARHRGPHSPLAPPPDPAREVAAAAGIPPRCVRVVSVTEVGLADLPLLPNGKPDHTLLRALAETLPEPPADPTASSLQQRYAALFGRDVTEADSFASLGGDSLSYVEASLHVEEHLGRLPRDWHVLPVGELEAIARRQVLAHRTTQPDAGPTPTDAPAERAPRRPSGTSRITGAGLRAVETSVVLRAVAILLIVGNHAHVFRLQGTAHALLVVVGWNLARFHLGEVPREQRARGVLRALRRVAAPALVVIVGSHLIWGDYQPATLALANWVFGEARLGPDWRFWFIESVVLVLLVVALVVATPWGDRLERRLPVLLPLALAGLGMLAWQEVLHPPVPHMQGSALLVSWLFALGWAAAKASSTRQRLLVSAVALPSVGTFTGDPRRDLLTLVAALLVIWVPTLPVPRAVVPALRVLAASSLYVYVAHWAVVPRLSDHPWLAYAAGLAAGLAYWVAWTRVPWARWSRAVVRRARPSPLTPPTPPPPATPAPAPRARRRSGAALG